jgi:hypothetical protein
VIRYTPNELKGEIINVGLLFHNLPDKRVKYFMLDEKSNKLKAIMESETELNLYKTYRDILEFYLDKSKEDISGVVGNMYVASYYDEEFMNKMYDYYKEQSLLFSKPNVAFTKDEEKLFETILKRYVGEDNINLEKTTTLNAKKYMKKVFDSNVNLSKRIKSDVVIKPIKDLNDLEVKIDFTFKNGKWNYMQAIPKITKANKNLEWFSEIQLMLQNEEIRESKIHLLYKESDFIDDKATYNLLRYLRKQYKNVSIYNVDKRSEVDSLCEYIETEAQVLENAV